VVAAPDPAPFCDLNDHEMKYNRNYAAVLASSCAGRP
jgi:hypothetical protein